MHDLGLLKTCTAIKLCSGEDKVSLDTFYSCSVPQVVIHDDTVDYAKAVPLDYETDVFSVHLEKGEAVFAFKQHYADVPSAKAGIGPFIMAWEALVYLNGGADEFQLQYQNAEIIDRNPQPEPAGSKIHNVSAKFTMNLECRAKLHVGRGSYPEPPSAFVVSADVEVMLLRYKLYRERRDRISSMGFFVYTVLRESAGGNKEAAHRYGISQTVLRKLSELTTTKGGKEDGRKAPYGEPYTA